MPRKKTPPTATTTATLSDANQRATDELLIAGCTYEDIADTMTTSGAPITSTAIEAHFRARPQLHQARATRMIEAKDAMTDALKKHQPKTTDPAAELAEATLMLGLLGLHRDTTAMTTRAALTAIGHAAARECKTRSAALSSQKLQTLQATASTRQEKTHLENRILNHKLGQLQALIETSKTKGRLSKETLAQIDEIYGLNTK